MNDDVRRDCKHGQLARSCPICERDAEIDRLRAEVERLKSREITDEQIDELWCELRCVCDACWTDRDLHSPDCHEDTLEIIGIVECPECGGTGVPTPYEVGSGEDCPRCHGHRWIMEDK